MVDGKTGAVIPVESSSALTSQRVRHFAQARRVPRPARPFFCSRADVEHFQPGRVLFGSMAEQIQPLNLAPSARSIRRAHSEQSTYRRRRNAFA